MEEKSNKQKCSLNEIWKQMKDFVCKIIVPYFFITLIISLTVWGASYTFYGKNLVISALLSIFAYVAIVILMLAIVIALLVALAFVCYNPQAFLRGFFYRIISIPQLLILRCPFRKYINDHLFGKLDKVFKSSEKTKEVPNSNNRKYIIMSDCHRGVNNYADDFAQNELIYLNALDYYHKKNYTYVELGDGDELWENDSLISIRNEHKRVFEQLGKFIDKKDEEKNRFFMVWGNHDRIKKKLKKTGGRIKDIPEEFRGMDVPQGYILKLEDKEATANVFLVHGHQLDYFNWYYGRLGKWVTRKYWTRLQGIGFNDTTSPARNINKRDLLDNRLEEWLNNENATKKAPNLFIIAGHNHNHTSNPNTKSRYFNTGCCVYPRSITGVEIFKERDLWNISVVKWSLMSEAVKDIIESAKTGVQAKGRKKTASSKDPDQPLCIWKEKVVGPIPLKNLIHPKSSTFKNTLGPSSS